MTNIILITGGCGFIGANLVAHLAETGGPPVRVIDSEELGQRSHIADLPHEFVKGDIRDPDVVARALDGVGSVVHLAADTSVVQSQQNPALNFQTNVEGTFNLLMRMREAGLTRIVNASTGGAIVGEATLPIHEEIAPEPMTPYGAGKMAAEAYCSAFNHSYGFRAISLRFSNVYGPRSYHKGSVVAQFFKQVLKGKPLVIYGDGNQTRDFVHVRDICEGICSAITAESQGVYQLGSGMSVSVNELVGLIRETVGVSYSVMTQHVEFRVGEVKQNRCDVSKARNEIAFNPRTDLADGLEETWRWFLESTQAT